MTGLVDARGNTLKSHAKAQPIKQPNSDIGLGQWAGRDAFFANLPGGGIMQFDLSRLTLADFRSMRMHYQLGASLNVLTFVMHQIDWRIECENKEIEDFLNEDLRSHWTKLIFALSQSFWAGFSPIAVNYENRDGYVRIRRFKDIVPEECTINWKTEDGWAPPGDVKPKLHTYDGFKQNGHLIPVENSLWYPLLMENGDHWGRKLLKPAFPSWFFSNLIHLYANRYFERFGEPLPIGRAPFSDDVQMNDGTYIKGKAAMESIVSGIRSRAVTVLPSDRDPDSGHYEYDISYLESQMRGADFERYLNRLDEEMSLSVFTPILLFRTADVGSYNLGQAHLKIFEQMLNAIAGDIQGYIQNYLVDRMRVINFGEGSPIARWKYRRLGDADLTIFKEIVVEMIRQGGAKPDVEQLGSALGVKIAEVQQLTADPVAPGGPAAPDPSADTPVVRAARVPLQEAVVRAAREVAKGNRGVTLGYRTRVLEALVDQDGFSRNDAVGITDTLYGSVNDWLDDVAEAFTDAERCRSALQRVVDLRLAA
jgi:hypothetical protein